MRVVYARCCGLDVHKKTVVACVLITETSGEMHRHIRTFSTMTAGLLALADWLESLNLPVVAMESTGVYWRPVFNLIEEGRTIILVNAQHMKAVPGRKTDVKDAPVARGFTASRVAQSELYPSGTHPRDT